MKLPTIQANFSELVSVFRKSRILVLVRSDRSERTAGAGAMDGSDASLIFITRRGYNDFFVGAGTAFVDALEANGLYFAPVVGAAQL